MDAAVAGRRWRRRRWRPVRDRAGRACASWPADCSAATSATPHTAPVQPGRGGRLRGLRQRPARAGPPALRRRVRPQPARPQRLRLARPARAGPGGAGRGRPDLRPRRTHRRAGARRRAPPRPCSGTGRDPAGAAHRRLRGARRADRHLRGDRHRGRDGAARRPVRHHRAARRGRGAAQRPRRHRAPPDAAGPGPLGGGVRGLRPDGRALPGGRRARGAGPGTRGGVGVRPRPLRRHPAHLPAQTGGGGVQAGGAAVAGAAAHAARPGAPTGRRAPCTAGSPTWTAS